MINLQKANSKFHSGKLQYGISHFKNYLLFYEYFHGDTGRGVGASHQTGWTGLIAKLLQPRKEQAKAIHSLNGEAVVLASGE